MCFSQYTVTYKYSGLIYGGSEFYYNNMVIDGYIVASSNLGYVDSTRPELVIDYPPRLSGLLQYSLTLYVTNYIQLNYIVGINGRDTPGLSIIFNINEISVAPVIWNNTRYVILANRTIIGFYNFENKVYTVGVKIGYNGQGVFSIQIIIKSDSYIYTYRKLVGLQIDMLTHGFIYLNNTNFGNIYVNNVCFTKGDYIVVSVSPTEFTGRYVYFILELNGYDSINQRILLNISDGDSVYDYSDVSHEIFLADLPFMFPYNISLTIYLISNIPRVTPSPPRDISGVITVPPLQPVSPVIPSPSLINPSGVFVFTLYIVLFISLTKMRLPLHRVGIVSSCIILVVAVLFGHEIVITISVIALSISLSYELYMRWRGTYE